MSSFNPDYFLKRKILFIFIFMICPLISWSSGKCDFTAPRATIENMITLFDVPGQIITPLDECILSSDNQNPQKKELGRFVFVGGRTFRFYIYAHKIDAKLTMTQFKGGVLEKTKEILLFEATKKGIDKQVAYYDYVLDDEHIEFVMTFETIGDEEGCALMKWVEISTPGQ